jgi:hypothetical protein
VSGVFSARRLGGVVLAGVMALGLADFVLWRWAGSVLADSYSSWRDARIAEGFAVTDAPPRLTGWPFAARLIVAGFALRAGAAGSPTSVEFSAPEIDLSVAISAPRDLVITPALPARLRLGPLPPLALTATALSIHARLGARAEERPAVLTARDLNLSPEGNGGGAIRVAAIDLSLLPPDSDARVDFRLQARAIDLPAGVTWPFGRRIGLLDFTADLAPPLPLPIIDSARTAAAWRDAGGRLTLAPARLEWGGLSLGGEAHLTLDRALAPQAVGSVHRVDPAAAVATLARQGLMTRQSAMAIGAVLSLLAQPRTEGGKPEIDLPFTLDSGILSAAGVPLLRLPFFPGAAP